MKNRILSCLLAVALVLALLPAARGAEITAPDAAAAGYILRTTPEPQVGTLGGEWAVLGLARSGLTVPEDWYQKYYVNLEETLLRQDGVLHRRKYTEYSRVILALSALDIDARDLAGYDLTLPLGDHDATLFQGLNGPIWALLALDSRDYPVPQAGEGRTQATRQGYLDDILARQLPGGGWTLSGAEADPDVTAMALQALAKYRAQEAVSAAVEAALDALSLLQEEDGSFPSTETCAQVLIALCELGLSPEDPRFVKAGRSLEAALLARALPEGGFARAGQSRTADQMASEQALCALDALRLTRAGAGSLYTRRPIVSAPAVCTPDRHFTDIAGCPYRFAIEALAARGIVDGRSAGDFRPEGEVTRAEFAALLVRTLGLREEADVVFSDVRSGQWFAPCVGAVCRSGLMEGSDGRFSPYTAITREEALASLARAAALCGVAPEPQQPDNAAPLLRGEAAQLLYRLLERAELL